MEPRPYGQPPPIMGRGQPTLVSQQQQHMMMIQHQQFMARQQVIQQEQLQKQRQLQHEEEKQAGTISGNPNIQQQLCQPPPNQLPNFPLPNHPPNIPPIRPHHNSNLYNQPPPMVPPPVSCIQPPNNPPFIHDPAIQRELSKAPQTSIPGHLPAHFPPCFNQSVPPPSPVSNFTCPPPNFLPTSLLANPPPPFMLPMNTPTLPTPSYFSGTQHMSPLNIPPPNFCGQSSKIPGHPVMESKSQPFLCHPPGFDKTQPSGFDRSQPPGFDRNQPTGFDRSQPGFDKTQPLGFDRSQPPGFDRSQPSGFDRTSHTLGQTSVNDKSTNQRSKFGQLDNIYNPPPFLSHEKATPVNTSIKSPRPPLLDTPEKSSILGPYGDSNNKFHSQDKNSQSWQKAPENKTWPNSSNKDNVYQGSGSRYGLSKEVGRKDISQSSPCKIDAGGRLDHSRSSSSGAKSGRDDGAYRSSRESPGTREAIRSRDRISPHSGRYNNGLHERRGSTSTPRDNSHDRNRPNSRDNSHDRNRSNSRSRDNSHDRNRPHSRDNSHDRNRSRTKDNSHDRNRPHSRDNSHDRNRSRTKDNSHDRNRPNSRDNSHDRNRPNSRLRDNSHDRNTPGSRSRDGSRRYENRGGSRNYDNTDRSSERRDKLYDSRERSLSNNRDRNRSRIPSRERSTSTSRNSVSSRSDSYSRSRKLSPTLFGRDSSISRRDRTSKRSRSPSTEQSYSGQLSQYRQDLLNSENKNKNCIGLSPKRRKLDDEVDDDDFDVIKDDELQLDAGSVIYFTRSCPADLFFTKNHETGDMDATVRMVELENRFEEEIVKRADKVRETQSTIDEPAPVQPPHHHHHHHNCSGHNSSSCDSSSDDEDSDDDDDDDGSCSQIMEEWDKRKKHPFSLHPELWFNLKGQANDGPLCRCSIKSRQAGIRHEIYPGEKHIEPCLDETSNLHKLHHYRITMSPYTNFLTKVPTLINHDNHEYIFEGFSMFSHVKLENIPPCKLLRFNIEYTIHFIPESAPENFTIRSLNLFNRFIFTEVLELLDVDWVGPNGGCQRFHFLPRFCRTLPDSGCKEVLSMNTVLSFLLKSVKLLVDESRLEEIMNCGESEWHTKVDNLRGMIVTNPGMRPSSIRVDQLDRKVTTPVVIAVAENFGDSSDEEKKKTTKKTSATMEAETLLDETAETEKRPKYPLIIHQGYRPAQLSYAGDPVYRKAWKQYVKFRHLLNSKPKILAADKLKLKEQEEKLREIRMKKTMKREVTIELSSKGFLCTGLRADLCQHALMVPVLMSHLRFHICLDVLEETLDYKFEDRNQLQLALTHTSYRTNYGTNPDHTRNSLTNCGMRQVEYGDRRIHYQNTRKRGICILVDIMSRFGRQEETISEIPHNERLEFLGDAVIEFLTSVHLFYMFPWLEEGGLTTYRMALVQNQHLAVLARKLKLQDFMLYVHGPDLCHESDLRHAMANCCEAIMGALFLDGGLEVVDRIFSRALFDDEDVLLRTWSDMPKHVLQQEEPGGDRHWVKSSPILQKMEKFEERIGVKFNHIRILAKSFTHRNIGINPLTLGHNQRLEFLGDTVLQLVASEYLYKHYPEHHEGHLSLLRSSLVNSRTQGLVYDDLGMSEFVICNENAVSEGLDMKTKQRADILESFVGALFVDKDLDYCRTFCNVCFFPRLKDFILNQDWNDPKSQLQQCCLTLREVGGGEPDIPVYKVIKSIGPTNTRKYVVAVYFRGKRLARGTGHSIQQAEMAAATQALKKRAELFPILQHQRRFLERMKKVDGDRDSDEEVSTYRKLNHPRPSKRRHTPVKSRQKLH